MFHVAIGILKTVHADTGRKGGGEVPSDRLYANSLHPVSQTTAPKQHNTMAATLRRSLAWFKGIVRVF